MHIQCATVDRDVYLNTTGLNETRGTGFTLYGNVLSLKLLLINCYGVKSLSLAEPELIQTQV